MKLSRQAAIIKYPAKEFEATLRARMRLDAETSLLDLEFSGSLQPGTTHNYKLTLSAEEVVKILHALANSGKLTAGLEKPLASAARDLVRLTAIASGVAVKD